MGGVAMNPITLRNLPPEVARAIREKAKKEKISLNRAVIGLLEEATATGQRKKKDVLHHDLDRFAGCWTQEEYDEFMDALREQRRC